MLKKMLSMLFILAIFESSLFAKTVVVTDVDDTIKQSNSVAPMGMFPQILFGLKPFTYMSNILHEALDYYGRTDEVGMVYLSYSPKALINQKKWNEKHGFPAGVIHLRKLFGEDKVYEYKVKFIEKMIKEDPSISHLVCFGDNSSHDEYVYDYIRKNYPHIQTDIFIRDVRAQAFKLDERIGVKKVEGVDYFISEKDLINKLEFLSPELESDIYNSRIEKLIPKYVFKNYGKKLEGLLSLDKKVARKLANDLISQHYHETIDESVDNEDNEDTVAE